MADETILPMFHDINLLRVEDLPPKAYRLTLDGNGVYVLQGYFEWRLGLAGGGEWRDIPTVKDSHNG